MARKERGKVLAQELLRAVAMLCLLAFAIAGSTLVVDLDETTEALAVLAALLSVFGFAGFGTWFRFRDPSTLGPTALRCHELWRSIVLREMLTAASLGLVALLWIPAITRLIGGDRAAIRSAQIVSLAVILYLPAIIGFRVRTRRLTPSPITKESWRNSFVAVAIMATASTAFFVFKGEGSTTGLLIQWILWLAVLAVMWLLVRLIAARKRSG